MNRQPFKWKEVSLRALQKALSSGQIYVVPAEPRPEWTPTLNTVSGAWLYTIGQSGDVVYVKDIDSL